MKVALRPLEESDLEQVLLWRRRPRVTWNMLTDVDDDLGKQRDWYRRITADPSCVYWVIEVGDRSVGLVNLAELDLSKNACTIGYYIGEEDFVSLAGIFLPYVYNHVFKDMRLARIHGKVLTHNTAMLAIHKMHGYRILEILKDHARKGGQAFDAVSVELLAEDWLKLKRYASSMPELRGER